MTTTSNRESILDYCKTFGFPLCQRLEYEAYADVAYQQYLALITDEMEAPPAVITETGRYNAELVTGDWLGIVIDVSYLDTAVDFIEGLVVAENGLAVAEPMRQIVADQISMAGLAPQALMLRHQPLNDLYALDEAHTGLRLLQSCDEVLDLLDGFQSLDRTFWLQIFTSYIIAHEVGHWLYQNHSNDNAIGRSIEEIRPLVERITNAPIDQRLTEAAMQLEDEQLETSVDELTEEVFCDRFAGGIVLARCAADDTDWRQAFIYVRLLLEAKHLIDKAKWIAADFLSDRRFLKHDPSLKANLVRRGRSPQYLRATLVTSGMQNYLQAVYNDYGSSKTDVPENISDEIQLLIQQSLAVFTFFAGPTMERCLFLLLRTVKSLSGDEAVNEFFEGLSKRHGIAHEDDVEKAFHELALEASLE